MIWETASQKYVREYGDLLAQAMSGSSLNETERDLLRGILRFSPAVVHLQSGHGHVNDTFPGRGAVEWQWTLGEIITAVAAAGMEIMFPGEYPEPFWRAGGVSAAAWSGRLPNSFALLARRA